MRELFRRHGATVLLSLACGAICGLPHLTSEANSPYLQPDEQKYAGRIEALRAGDPGSGEIYLWEQRHLPVPVPLFTVRVAAALSALVGGTDALFTIADFVAPALVFFGLSVCGIRLGVPRGVVYSAVSLYVLHHSDLLALNGPARRHGVFDLLRWYLLPYPFGSILNPMTFSFPRFPYPLLPRVVEVLFLMLLFPALRRRNKAATVGAGAILAVVTVLRYFDWMVLYPALGFAAAASALRGRRADAAILASIVGIGLLTSLVYWAAAVGHPGDPAMQAHLLHSGLERTRALFPASLMDLHPIGPLCLGALVAACPLVGIGTPLRLAFVATTAALVLCCSIHVATGWTIGPEHWYKEHVMPIFTASAGAALAAGASRAAPWAAAAAAAASFLHGGAQFWTYAAEPERELAELRRALAGVEADRVVLSFDPMRAKLAAPRAWSFVGRAGGSPAPTEELLRRYVQAIRLFGRDRAALEALFEPPGSPDVVRHVAGARFKQYPPLGQAGVPVNHLPPEWKERWVAYFESLPTDPRELVAAIRAEGRRLDYVLVKSGDGPAFPWPAVYAGPLYRLYRVDGP